MLAGCKVQKAQEMLKKSEMPAGFAAQPGFGPLSPMRGLEVCLDASQRWV